jgi:hypothetical protein
MTGWCWFALVEGAVDERLASTAVASALATNADGAPVGTFAAWPAGRKAVGPALRMDERLVDPDGRAAWVSLVVVARQIAPLFDDVAVSQALRQVLRGWPPAAVSTLVRDATTFAGSVTVGRTDSPRRLRDDPFARLHPARVLRAGPGMFAALPAPAGPAIQRYTGKPWPAAGFQPLT